MLCFIVYPRIPSGPDALCCSFTSSISFNPFTSLVLPHLYHLTPLSSVTSELFSHFFVLESPANLLESSDHTHFPLTTEGVGGGANIRRNMFAVRVQRVAHFASRTLFGNGRLLYAGTLSEICTQAECNRKSLICHTSAKFVSNTFLCHTSAKTGVPSFRSAAFTSPVARIHRSAMLIRSR